MKGNVLTHETTLVWPMMLCSMLFLVTAGLQAQVSDGFSDGNFTHNPQWEGDSLLFKVNASGQLQTCGTGPDTAVLATRSTVVNDTEWHVWIKLSFNTSANNHGRIYLLADHPNLDMPVNGYFIQTGGSSDSICLMKQAGSEIRSLFCFPDYLTNQSVNAIRIKVTRDATGIWSGWLDPQGGETYRFQGSLFDNEFTTSQWFGLYCRYTSSNATRFYFDDIYVGPEVRDTVPPQVIQLNVMDSVRLSLLLSEIPDPSSACSTQHYMTRREQKHPVLVEPDGIIAERIILTFTDPFPEQTIDSLLISGIRDTEGNTMTDTLLPFAWFEPGARDILIHEIMADPDPPVGLPAAEYVELVNTTDFPVQMEGWRLDFSSSMKPFPAVTIPPHGYLLVAKDSALMPYGEVVQLFTSTTSLPNGGTWITLRDAKSRIIHSVEYTPEWGSATWKQEGGWSLEMKDQLNPCGCKENWDFSEDVSGGTPGRSNAIQQSLPDDHPPYLVRSYLADSLTWELLFSEPLDTLNMGSQSDWIMEPNHVNPVAVDPVEPGYSRIRLVFSTPFSTGKVYTLTASVLLSDCAGNLLSEPLSTSAAFPVTIERNDVIFNEVLFDPYPGSSRFVELFNRSDRVIDLASVGMLSATDDSLFLSANAKPVSPEPYLMFPFDYVAVCDEADLVKQTYDTPFPDRLITPASFPSLSNTQGRLALIRLNDEEVIDRMDFHKEMHYPLLSSTEGVSLERISAERPSRDGSNWHSASSQSGFATPGYQNSQWREELTGDDNVTLDPLVFSPDNDGRDDVTGISCSFGEVGGQVSVGIYTSAGRLVRQLASNVLIGATGSFLWDGTDAACGKVPVGVYIVLVEYLHPAGKVERIRKPVVVATRFR